MFLPLKLLLHISSLPKIASRAKAVVSLLSVAVSDPGCSLITCSIGTNLGGVRKGGGGKADTVAVDLGVKLAEDVV